VIKGKIVTLEKLKTTSIIYYKSLFSRKKIKFKIYHKLLNKSIKIGNKMLKFRNQMEN